MMTMEKSAIALRMTNGTGQFIRDYMFPKSKEDTVSTISDQLGAYREIKERVEDLENRIHLLDEISRQNLALQTTRADKIHVEQVLKYIDIESFKTKIEARSQDLMDINEKIRAREKQQNENNEKKTQLTNALVEVEAELKSSDYGQKEKELKSLKEPIKLLARNSEQWREVVKGLVRWEEDEEISAYVSNPALQRIDEIKSGPVSKAAIVKLKKHLSDALESINEEVDEIGTRSSQNRKDLKEKKEMVEELKNDRKPYRK